MAYKYKAEKRSESSPSHDHQSDIVFNDRDNNTSKLAIITIDKIENNNIPPLKGFPVQDNIDETRIRIDKDSIDSDISLKPRRREESVKKDDIPLVDIDLSVDTEALENTAVDTARGVSEERLLLEDSEAYSSGPVVLFTTSIEPISSEASHVQGDNNNSSDFKYPRDSIQLPEVSSTKCC
eukprot:CAMPEP_0182423364 /NCGR_PEP_ID=MMETSP1167-20130531/9342_1 /TAXON_ID=2988 /ORGANISM="Mallomonas Sp, Strain CCMP3275" /LENGTH=180 /DNA_ID=CAMNT_0024602269 /DNA_START=297 /DNA_END=836 /DNA_ORIENTATION=-